MVFEDFKLKTADPEEAKKKEQLVLEQLRKGELAAEIITGELKLQFEEGVGLLAVSGKEVAVIGINITNYTAEGKST